MNSPALTAVPQIAHPVTIVIPARWGSSRFPGKPLALVAGIPVIERVWRISRMVTGADVLVATDDVRILERVEAFGGSAILTDPNSRTGGDRTEAAIQARGTPVHGAVNVQGDAILTPPWVIQALVDRLKTLPAQTTGIITPAVRLTPDQLTAFVAAKRETPASGTTVVTDNNGRALYFSKHVLPFSHAGTGAAPVWRHIGLYGYTATALTRFAELPTGQLEASEGLEQLRALENGIPITVVEVDYRGRTHWSIDAAADIPLAEQIIAAEGELA